MKLVIQIPCYNEAESLPVAVEALPREIAGIDSIEILVIDDGSTDGTSSIAHQLGVHHIVRHRRNQGLAAAFRSGIGAALAAGADIIVNTDADNQYDARDIPILIAPILEGRADIVIGDRQADRNPFFGVGKRRLQVVGSKIVQMLSGTTVPDAVSGFRAISRASALKINIVSDFSYTTEMLIQAGRMRLAVTSVPVRTNASIRPSRLFTSIPKFIKHTSVTMVRAYTMYNPLRVFMIAGTLSAMIGMLPVLRFLFYYLLGEGSGKVQSLVIGGVFLSIGLVSIMFGIVADLIGRNRQLLEMVLERVRALEHATATTEDMGVELPPAASRAGASMVVGADAQIKDTSVAVVASLKSAAVRRAR